ncbi:Hypothetical predicted protein, partial [Pelobates cultripes]
QGDRGMTVKAAYKAPKHYQSDTRKNPHKYQTNQLYYSYKLLLRLQSTAQ